MKYFWIVSFLFFTSALYSESINLGENWEILENPAINYDEVAPEKLTRLEGWKKYSTNISLAAEKTHILRLKLPERDLRQPTLLFGKNIFSFEVIYSGKSVYKFADKTQYEPGKFLGWVSQIVSLPKNKEDNTVYLKVYSGAKIGFAAVSYGEKDEIYEEIISRNFAGVAVFVISLLLGIIFISIYIFSSRDLFYLATASFYIFIGIWLFNINPISQFVLPESPWRLRAEYISLYLAPIGCLFFLESIVISRLNIISRFLRYILFLYAVISAFLDLAGIFPLWKTLIPFDIFLIFSFLHYIYQVIVYSYRGNKEARIIGIGIILLVSFALHDILVVLRIVDNIMLMHLGTLSFILSMTGVAVLRITYLYSDLKKKSKELEENNKVLDDLNQNLENKIEERTKELAAAKRKTENLSSLIKDLNETSGIKNIMQMISDYVSEKFDLPYHSLFILNPQENRFKFVHAVFPDYVPEDFKRKIELSSYSLDAENQESIHSSAIRNKVPIFIPDAEKEIKTEAGKILISILKHKSFLTIPIFLQNSPIGTLDFFSLEKIQLDSEQIAEISLLTEHLAGVIQNSLLFKEVQEEKEKAERERQKSDKLLLNILPKDVAAELKENGFAEPVLFENVSVMFTDFKGFTSIAEKLSPQELVKDLDACFVQFDKISERYNLEKLKTIGDSYMCAGGIPRTNATHAIDCILAALEIQDFMNLMKSLKEERGFPYWELRLGIHSGALIAGVIGEKKFAYDVWGDTVNTASRMESSGTPGKINISGITYELVKEYFECDYRGKVNAKNKGEVEMYYVNGLKLEYSKDGNGRTPNGKFWENYGYGN